MQSKLLPLSSSILVIMAMALVPLAVVAGAAGEDTHGDPLSMTLLGALEPEGQPRLAVRWDGPPGELFDVWVDLDGDGHLDHGELVVEGRPLDPSIEVVKLDIPAEAYSVSDPSVLVRARGLAPVEAEHSADQAHTAAGQDGGAWQSGFARPGLWGRARALCVFDDGRGPALYAGGKFSRADDVTVSSIARWDGSAWSALEGPSGVGVMRYGRHHDVNALAVFDDGRGPMIYAGGSFSEAGGVVSSCLGVWQRDAGNDAPPISRTPSGRLTPE